MSQLGLVGQLSMFDDSNEDFTLYIERLEQYFFANEIPDTKQVSVLISVLGPKTYKLLRNLFSPKLPKDCTYAEIVKKLNDHFRPAPITIAERFKFHRRNQGENENIADYIVELKRLASTCEFGTFLEEALRDRFVCGLRCEATQKRLLAKKTLTLDDALDTALAMELADLGASNIKAPNQQQISKVSKFQNSKWVKHPPQKSTSKQNTKKCFRCGASHDPNRCKYKNAKCHVCSKVGHIAPVCFSKDKMANHSAKKVTATAEQSNSEEYNLFSINVNKLSNHSRYIVQVKICDKVLDMELDTAADVSIISEKWLKDNLPHIMPKKVSVTLKDYNQKPIEIVGEVCIKVVYESQMYNVQAIVVKGDRPSLFGKDWIRKFKLNWHKIFSVHKIITDTPVKINSLNTLTSKYSKLFEESSEPIKHIKASLKMKKETQPVFLKARPVPYSLKNKVSEEILKSKERGVWNFVQHSNWATPLVIVPKKNGDVRLCGDFKVTVNKFMEQNQYPLPTQQDLFATLNGGQYFSKLDLRHAYQQIELDECSQEYLTLNTHLGLVRPVRLLYGINSASAIFQSTIEKILHGIESVICFQDDILVTGATYEEHLKTLEKVFQRFCEYNVKLNLSKCSFLQKSVEFLGHIIDSKGIHPTDEKIQCIKKINAPSNVTELKSFLGILNYYSKFIRNSAMLLAPLYKLLHKDTPWAWSSECDETFQKCKNILTSDAVLVHYNDKLPLKVSCDASPVGLGVVLSHIIDNDERPVAYASRTLSKAEQNYSQIEKEAAAIIFGIKKFQQYLFGRKFVLVTDHKPLISIFSPDKAVPAIAAARLQRWAVLLSSFNYSIEYKKGSEHGNADALSRAPVESEVETHSEVFKISYCQELPVTSIEIAKATRNDAVLGLALKYVQNGWPLKINNEALKPYFNRQDQLSVDNNCLLWGMRVIIPEKYRRRLLDQLHDTHSGISKMKAMARSHVWWPKLDQEIEEVAKNCPACQTNSHSPPGTPLQPWTWSKHPWDRVHIDFAQKDQKNYLLLVDSHSKWLEVMQMPSMTAPHTIEALQQIFSRYGLPLELVSDNGPQLVSEEFEWFLKSNGVKHTLIPTYHPQSNGLAERNVQTFKEALRKMNSDAKDHSTLSRKISRFLMNYRSMPHSTTGLSPAELFLARPIRTLLALVHPSTQSRVEQNQRLQKKYYDRCHTRNRSFTSDEKVLIRSHRNQEWSRGTLIKPQGSKTWLVNVNNKMYRAHVDQLRHDHSKDDHDSTNLDNLVTPDHQSQVDILETTHEDDRTEISRMEENTVDTSCKPETSNTLSNEEIKTPPPAQKQVPTANNTPAVEQEIKSGITVRRNPPRTRKKPLRLNL